IGDWRAGETRDVHQEMMHLTLETVVKTLFGTDTSVEARDVGEAIEAIANYFSSQSVYLLPLSLLPTPSQIPLDRAMKRLDRIIHEIIRVERHNGHQRDNLLWLLLQARDEEGNQMTDRQLRDEVMTIFLAGHETTALALSWTWYLLGSHPEIETRL